LRFEIVLFGGILNIVRQEGSNFFWRETIGVQKLQILTKAPSRPDYDESNKDLYYFFIVKVKMFA